MAANVHLQQAHGGSGSILDGPGPGMAAAEPAPAAATPGVHPVETPATSSQDEQGDTVIRRRSQRTPKPLHAPAQSVPDDAMSAMLQEWDRIGSMSASDFIHSSMVSKVYAAKPTDDGEDCEYEPSIPVPSGDNPFLREATNASASSTDEQVPCPPQDATVFSGPFAAAMHAMNPFRTRATPNPFLKRDVQFQDRARAKVPAAAPSEPEASDARTVFGQLPLFGDLGVSDPTPAAQNSGQVADVSSPFSDASPFAHSEFETEEFEFTASGDVAMPGDLPATPSSPQRFECEACGKSFNSEFGLASHAHAKHDGPKPPKALLKKSRHQESVDLPAYVPSPVDFSQTGLFKTHGSAANEMEWSDLELKVHGFAASNITLVGAIKEKTSDGMLIEVDDEQFRIVADGIHPLPGATVCVSGSLQLNPKHDVAVNKYFYEPFIWANPPMGSVVDIS